MRACASASLAARRAASRSCARAKSLFDIVRLLLHGVAGRWSALVGMARWLRNRDRRENW